MSRRIIVASAHVMDGTLKLGSSHIARTLAEAGHEVLYLNHPTSLLHLLHPRSRQASRRRLSAAKLRGSVTPRMQELTPFTLVPHLPARVLRSPATLRHWHQLTYPRIEHLIAKAGFADADLILFDTVMFWPLVEALGIPSVYRVADRIDGFDVNTPAMIELHRTALRDAGFVLHTAAGLAPTRQEREKPSRHIPNGVHFDLFQGPRPRPKEYEGLAGPIVVYVGAIESWFDIPGVAEAARTLPRASFIIIGPIARELDIRPMQLPNVHLLGPRPHELVPGYLQHADIGIIPFDLQSHGPMLDAVSPLKLFEYFACGLPSVCYGGAEVLKLETPATIYDPRGDSAPGGSKRHATLACALAEAVSALPTPPQEATRLLDFAFAADWRQRVGELMRLLETQGVLKQKQD